VEELTKTFIESYGAGSHKNFEEDGAPHEAKLLLLNSDRALQHLGWKSQMDARTAIRWTAEWYADKHRTANEKCLAQIQNYF
jgi:CDP-glucose 4,6-dehydratase